METTDTIPDIQAAKAAELANEIITTLEKVDSQKKPNVITRLQRGDFELDGLHFSFTRDDGPQGTKLHIRAQVGYLPYTAESCEKRKALSKILLSARAMRRVRFQLDKKGHIALQSTIDLSPESDDIDAIMGLTAIYQESGPLLRLIAKYL